jgi:hypothetical protein
MGLRRKMDTAMTASGQAAFQTRLNRVAKRRNSRLSSGYLISNNVDGIAIARVRRAERSSPLTGVMFAAILVIAAKSVAVAFTGAAAYDARIARLAEGTASERMAAVALQADPVTSAIATRLAPLFARP